MLVYKLAVCVDDSPEFEAFYGQYMQGVYVDFQVFAFSEDEHQRAA